MQFSVLLMSTSASCIAICQCLLCAECCPIQVLWSEKKCRAQSISSQTYLLPKDIKELMKNIGNM